MALMMIGLLDLELGSLKSLGPNKNQGSFAINFIPVALLKAQLQRATDKTFKYKLTSLTFKQTKKGLWSKRQCN